MIIICPRGSDSQASKNNGENNENVPRVCVNYCIFETEHDIKTAKASIRHSAMIACWQRALFVLYYFLLLSQPLPSNIEIYWIYRQGETRVQYGRCLRSRTATEPAFIKLRRLNRLTFSRNGISIYGLWSPAFYDPFASPLFGAERDYFGEKLYDGQQTHSLDQTLCTFWRG